MNPRLFTLGFILVAIGALILFAGTTQSSSSSVGGVIFIGPLPIVFGNGPDAGVLIIASLIITGLMILFYLSALRSRHSPTQDGENTH